jgi:transcriptional regulator with XRE-family HTH domain
MRITGEHVRMLRGAFRMPIREFAEFTKVATSTVVSLEGGTSAWAKTLMKIETAFAPYVEFVEPVEGVRGPGIILKPGFESVVRDTNQGAATSQSDDKGGIDALGWDWEEDANSAEDDDEPLPPLEWTDEEKREHAEFWRSHPEKWERFNETSRQCLLRAMGVTSLGAE